MEFIKKYWIVIIVTFGLCMFIKPALCFLIGGTLITFFGVMTTLFLKKIKKSGVEWTGNIIEFEIGNKGHKTPIIEFTTTAGELVKGKPYIYASTDLSIIRSYDNLIGKSLTILYDPDEPKKFVVKNEEGFSFIVSIVLILGGLFFVGLSICWLLGIIKMG